MPSSCTLDGMSGPSAPEDPDHRERVQPGRFELGTDGPKTIVVGVDGTDTSMRAGAYAARTGTQAGRPAHLRVRPTHAGHGVRRGGRRRRSRHQQSGRRRDRRTDPPGVGLWHIHAEFISADGDPYTVITGIAHDVSADAIVVGASTRLGHRIAGSLAVRLVKCGKWPVTVVP